MAEENAPMEETCPVREQDKFLPIANISRIMKEALPQNAKVSKDAKELVQNCVSDFIIYITSQYAASLLAWFANHVQFSTAIAPQCGMPRCAATCMPLTMPSAHACLAFIML